MAVNCDPNELANAAKCFECLPESTRKAIETYLLCLLASNTNLAACLQTTGDPNTQICGSVITFTNTAQATHWVISEDALGQFSLQSPENGTAGLIIPKAGGTALELFYGEASVVLHGDGSAQMQNENGQGFIITPAGIFNFYTGLAGIRWEDAGAGILVTDASGNFGVAAEYDSGNIPWPVSTSTILTFSAAHGLGYTPTRVRAYWNTTLNEPVTGWNAGDQIDVSGTWDSTTVLPVVAFAANATTVFAALVASEDDLSVNMIKKTGGPAVVNLRSNWSLRIAAGR